jgi:hypothetical protein
MPFHDELGGFAREGIGFLVGSSLENQRSAYKDYYDRFKDSEARKALSFAADIGKPVSLPAFFGRGPNAALGFFTGQNPIDSLKRYYSRYYHQPEYDPEDKFKLGFARPEGQEGMLRPDLPEGSVKQREVARALEQLTHPTVLAAPGLGGVWRAGELLFIGGEFLTRHQARKAGWSETQIDIAGLAAGAVASAGTGVKGPTLSRLAKKLGKGLAEEDLGHKVAGFAKPIRDELVDAATTGRELIRKNLRTATDEFKSKAINIADLDVATAKLGTIVRMPKTTRGMARYVIKTGPAPGWRDPRTALEKLRETTTGRITEGTTYVQRELTRGLSEQFKEFGLDPFFWTPLQKNEALGIWNPLRTVSEPDVRRGGNAIIKRLDFEFDKGELGYETHLLAREFVRQLAITAPHLLENVGFSTIKSLGGVNPALVTQGQFDLASHIVTLAKGATDDPRRLVSNPEEYVGTLAHELSHSFELWVSEVDLLKVVNKYNKELESTGKRAIREAEDAFAYVAELKMLNPLRSRIAKLTEEITTRLTTSGKYLSKSEVRSKILDRSKYQATLRQFEADLPKLVRGPELERTLIEAEKVMAQAVNRAYRYTSIHEFVAENLRDRLLYLYERGQLARMGQSIPAPKPDAFFDGAVGNMRQIIAGIARALRVFGASDDLIEEITEKLLVKHYPEPSPAMRRGSYGLDRQTILGGADAPATPSYLTPEVAAQQGTIAETVHGPWIRDPSIEAIEVGQGELVFPKRGTIGPEAFEEGTRRVTKIAETQAAQRRWANFPDEPFSPDADWQRKFDELLEEYKRVGDPLILENVSVYGKENQLKLIEALLADEPKQLRIATQFLRRLPDKYFQHPGRLDPEITKGMTPEQIKDWEGLQDPWRVRMGFEGRGLIDGSMSGAYEVVSTMPIDLAVRIARTAARGGIADDIGDTIVHEYIHHLEHVLDKRSYDELKALYKSAMETDGKIVVGRYQAAIDKLEAGPPAGLDSTWGTLGTPAWDAWWRDAVAEAQRTSDEAYKYWNFHEFLAVNLADSWKGIAPGSLLSKMPKNVQRWFMKLVENLRDIFRAVTPEQEYTKKTLEQLLKGEFPSPKRMPRSITEDVRLLEADLNPSIGGFHPDILEPNNIQKVLDRARKRAVPDPLGRLHADAYGPGSDLEGFREAIRRGIGRSPEFGP